MMEKVDLKSGEVITKESAFLSKTEVNLESTRSNCFRKLKKLFWSLLHNFKDWEEMGDFVQF